MMSVLCIAIFWVVNAKNLYFRIYFSSYMFSMGIYSTPRVLSWKHIFPDNKMSSRCANGKRTRADFHARMRSRKHTVVSAYEVHSTRGSSTVCLGCATQSARTDTIGTLSARLRVILVRSRSHDVTARCAGNVCRTNGYLDFFCRNNIWLCQSFHHFVRSIFIYPLLSSKMLIC